MLSSLEVNIFFRLKKFFFFFIHILLISFLYSLFLKSFFHFYFLLFYDSLLTCKIFYVRNSFECNKVTHKILLCIKSSFLQHNKTVFEKNKFRNTNQNTYIAHFCYKKIINRNHCQCIQQLLPITLTYSTLINFNFKCFNF